VNKNVIDVQESSFLKPDIHESSLHPGQNSRDPSFINISNDSFSRSPLNQQLLNLAILEKSNSRLRKGCVDD
jgi:hypothetical protein